MSSFAWIIVLTLILTALGTLVLLLITLKYYWGARGTPPVTGEQRRLQKEEELVLRAKQIEQSKKTRGFFCSVRSVWRAGRALLLFEAAAVRRSRAACRARPSSI